MAPFSLATDIFQFQRSLSFRQKCLRLGNKDLLYKRVETNLLTVGSISSFPSSGKSDGLNTVVLDCFVVVSLSKSLTGVYGMKSGN